MSSEPTKFPGWDWDRATLWVSSWVYSVDWVIPLMPAIDAAVLSAGGS